MVPNDFPDVTTTEWNTSVGVPLLAAAQKVLGAADEHLDTGLELGPDDVGGYGEEREQPRVDEGVDDQGL
ncbi:hypothetical protein HGRIS_000016 [Hohenbuehelia grisea]|uniref:Uncharacterized protein n=1 Tax=Hohenbuehelia grisea TaxID=104357 RepID=A0ABR3JPT8_9AGAR